MGEESDFVGWWIVTEPFSPSGDLADIATVLEITVEDATATSVVSRDTDRANALEFVELFGDVVLWTPEKGWFLYDGVRWKLDTKTQRNKLIAKLIDRLFQRSRIVDGNDRTILRNRVRRLESHGGLIGAFKYAESMLAKSIVEMDKHPYLLNCLNGTFDLRTGEQVERSAAHYITRLCPTVYNPEAVDPVWDRVWHEAFADNKEQMAFFQRYIGYSLTGDYSMKTFVTLHGPSDAGKSTIVEPLHVILGDVDEDGYVTTWDADVLHADSTMNRGEKLDKSRSARLILVGELEKGKRMADGFVKKFTGGNVMDAKALYKGSYSFKPQGKLLLDTNYVPKSADPAVHNRLVLLPMTHIPKEKDSRIKVHLETNTNAHMAILAWAIRGSMAWWLEHSLGPTPWLAESMKKYVKSSDVLVNFVEDCYAHTELMAECVPVTFVYPMYVAWCADEGGKPMQRRTFMDAMEERGHVKHRLGMGGATVMTGIKLKNLDDYSEMVKSAVLSNLMGKSQK